MSRNVDKARRCWPDPVPDWVLALARACDDTSQGAVADRIAYSKGVVSTVISYTYRGDLNAVEKAVKGGLMDATVTCPVAGELKVHVCQSYQRQPFSSTNSQRVQLYRACRSGCPHSRHTREDS